MKTAIVIGGTGMLGAATRGLAERGYEIALLARGAERFAAEIAYLHPYPADWADEAGFLARLDSAAAAHGPISLALFWTHDRPRGLALKSAEVLARHGGVERLFHVLGSAVSDPANEAALIRAEEAFERVLPGAWRPICLGFMIENGISRWLTHAEISAGTLAAIDGDRQSATIGVTRPWHKRP